MNIFYAGVRPNPASRMPGTWQSWLLRIATFVAITASMWQTMAELYDLMYFYEYGAILSALGNMKAMTAIVGLLLGGVVYMLYTAYVRFAYTGLARQLFFCDKTITMWQYRKVADTAMIALCTIKALLSVIWFYNPQYSTLLSSIIDPLVAVGVMLCAFTIFVKYAGKGNAAFVAAALAVWYCMPALFA